MTIGGTMTTFEVHVSVGIHPGTDYAEIHDLGEDLIRHVEMEIVSARCNGSAVHFDPPQRDMIFEVGGHDSAADVVGKLATKLLSEGWALVPECSHGLVRQYGERVENRVEPGVARIGIVERDA